MAEVTISSKPFRNKLLQYFWNILVLFSQLISVLLGGHPDVSLSQRTGLAYLAHKGTGTFKEKWFTAQKGVINFLFKPWEKDHCLNSLNGEAWASTVWDWKK